MALGLVIARWLHWAACLLLVSSQLFGPFLMPRTEASSAVRAWKDGFHARLGQFAQAAWALALLSGIVWVALTFLIMTGAEGGLSVVLTVITRTQFGRVSMFRFVILVCVGCGLFAAPREISRNKGRSILRLLAIVLATVNVLALALTGHAAGTPGLVGGLHLAVDAAHLAAASVWPGGLVCFALLLSLTLTSPALDLRTTAAQATDRFSASSLAAVAVLSATGLANGLFILHDLQDLWTTDYGRLLLIKILVFLGMLGCGAWNLLVLKRKLRQEASGKDFGPAPTTHALFRMVLWEIVLGAVVVLVVAVLGITEPPRL